MKIANCTLILLLVLGFTPAFGQLKVPAPQPDTVISYQQKEDGSIVRMQETVTLRDLSMLQTKRAVMDSQCKLFDALDNMTPEQLQAAHTLWERYREPIGKGIITVPQAVVNMTATTREEIKAMDEVIKK